MAHSFEDAFDKVAGPDLDRIIYSARAIHRAAPNQKFCRSMSGLDNRQLRQGYEKVARRRGCCIADAEDAVQEELTVLMEKHPDLFDLDIDLWWGAFLVRAAFRVLKNRARRRLSSLDVLTEGGDAALDGAEPLRPVSPDAEEDAGNAPLPRPGEEWSRPLIVSSLQRFRRWHGRPPTARECRARHRLPSYQTIRDEFGGLGAALLAAGIVPSDLGRRHQRWTPLEAARACHSFYRQNGYWPGATEATHHPDLLPGRSVMLRCFGSTHGGEIRAVAEAILGTDPRRRRRRRRR
jgi:hypothetical protein